jgi:hypothetical protein
VVECISKKKINNLRYPASPPITFNKTIGGEWNRQDREVIKRNVLPINGNVFSFGQPVARAAA